MNIPQFHVHQDPLTDPGERASLYDDLPTTPSGLRDVVSELIVHLSRLAWYGLSPRFRISRETQPVAKRLELIQASWPGSLLTPRPVGKRSFGTCRDYALLLCSMLRHRSIAARVRCGFATYFATGPYEDHWICEYWLSDERRWARADAQLDHLHRERLGIRFDGVDLPHSAFLTAGQAWKMTRSGVAAADDFGHGEAKGLWFLRVNVHRDLFALTNQHTSAWDTWRTSTTPSKTLDPADKAAVDLLTSVIEEIERDAGLFEFLKDIAAKNQVPPWRS